MVSGASRPPSQPKNSSGRRRQSRQAPTAAAPSRGIPKRVRGAMAARQAHTRASGPTRRAAAEGLSPFRRMGASAPWKAHTAPRVSRTSNAKWSPPSSSHPAWARTMSPVAAVSPDVTRGMAQGRRRTFQS